MTLLSEQQIVRAWQDNAVPWGQAIAQGEIKSRILVTNKAIVDAVLARAPATVLDIGCGEGWLSRALVAQGIDVLGVDVVADLITQAQSHNSGRYRTMAYQDLCAESVGEKFDLLLANFSLLGKESVEHLFAHASDLLNHGGAFMVQTLHPQLACGDEPYQDGWRQGSWAGFSPKLSAQFSTPAPWYFRTLASWQTLFARYELQLDVVEPKHPESQQVVSLIFIGSKI